MRTFVIALALVTSLAGLAVAQERRTPRCKLLYGNYEYENRNWEKIEAQLIEAGGCTTTTTAAPTTTTTAAPTTTTAAPTTTTTTL